MCAAQPFSSYLSHQFQAIKIGSTLSELHELLFGVPQGSVLIPLLFSLHTTPLSKVIRRHSDIKLHFYADDTQLLFHLSYKNATSAFDKLDSCLQDVQEWMSSSMLKLDPEKTEFIIFASHAHLKKLDSHLPVRIFGKLLYPSAVIKKLCVWFDANFPLLIMSSVFVRLAAFRCVISGGSGSD